jgi:hypothetical protein
MATSGVKVTPEECYVPAGYLLPDAGRFEVQLCNKTENNNVINIQSAT